MAAWLIGIFTGATIASVLWCVYVCGDERGFTSGTYLDGLLEERERMRRSTPCQGPSVDPWWEY